MWSLCMWLHLHVCWSPMKWTWFHSIALCQSCIVFWVGSGHRSRPRIVETSPNNGIWWVKIWVIILWSADLSFRHSYMVGRCGLWCILGSRYAFHLITFSWVTTDDNVCFKVLRNIFSYVLIRGLVSRTIWNLKIAFETNIQMCSDINVIVDLSW